jgi:hypothetical protein
MAATAIAFTTMPVLLGARSAQAGKTVLIDTVLPGDELVDRAVGHRAKLKRYSLRPISGREEATWWFG